MPALKHRLKRRLRAGLAWTLHVTRLRRLFRRGRRGVPVLMFHNVGHPAETDYLPGHMKVGEARLERLLAELARGGDATMT
ncbi:MAG TPA: hypothetical protein VFD43_00045, partial [Planctomycetota bacterium]|nr:hypothetical protein [Planctomycetota bacterium]